MTDTIYEEAHLNLPSGVSFKEWMKVGRTLSDMANSTPWWVGDWVNYGEAKYGETYSQGLTLWSCAYQSLANMAYVARQYPPETRTSLSWTHHRYAASLPLGERLGLLERAKEEEWTSRQLQVEVAKLKEPDTGEESVVWVRYTVEIETSNRSIKRTSNNINQHLVQINELNKAGLIDKPCVKVLEVGTCGGHNALREC